MAATISLMVYSVTERSTPSYTFFEMKGSPMALCRVWWVIEYATSPQPHSAAICFMIAVLPIPGGPMSSTGRCFSGGMTCVPSGLRRI